MQDTIDELVKSSGVEVKNVNMALICRDHPGEGMAVFYEAGVIVVRCGACSGYVGQFQVAERGPKLLYTEGAGNN